ncbi:MAG: hypothetical protein FVQ79_03385 [Planctomycetes bacterium]|nr:hypothetical protein [Planctomycetota bacterium]
MARRKLPFKKIYPDFSTEDLDDPVLKARADAITSAGAAKHQIAIDIGGTTFYLVAYAHGS